MATDKLNDDDDKKKQREKSVRLQTFNYQEIYIEAKTLTLITDQTTVISKPVWPKLAILPTLVQTQLLSFFLKTQLLSHCTFLGLDTAVVFFILVQTQLLFTSVLTQLHLCPPYLGPDPVATLLSLVLDPAALLSSVPWSRPSCYTPFLGSRSSCSSILLTLVQTQLLHSFPWL
jgi:hypothetical protein